MLQDCSAEPEPPDPRPICGEQPNQLEQVHDDTKCNARSFYMHDEHIELCPQACALVQADRSTEIDLRYGCNPVPQ